MASNLLTAAVDSPVATIGDLPKVITDSDVAVTGLMKYALFAGFYALGRGHQHKISNGSWNFLESGLV